MEQQESSHRVEHVIDITVNGDAPSSSSSHDGHLDGLEASHHGNGHSESTRASLPSELSVVESNRRSTSVRRADLRRHRSPLYSGLWISIELTLTMGQIIAAIVTLSLSRHEHPHTPLFVWIVGYASGCVATLPLLYWRYRHRNQMSQLNATEQRQNSQVNLPGRPFSVSVSRTSEEDDPQAMVESHNSAPRAPVTNPRVKVLMEYFKTSLDCFFAIWFVVGNVWVFGGRSSVSEAPNLYRLCIVFLVFSCIGYAMPFILCATICCCLPCIISMLGYREEMQQNRGATPESINALPTYKFKLKKNKNGNDERAAEGGVVAAGTSKERTILGEDAVCCICLGKYTNNDELRELPCSHMFHKECVDKWLKINASCPLCKIEVGETLPGANWNQRHGENISGTGLAGNVL